MDENLHNIDDLFKNAINGHQEMPSHNVWEQIDKNLDKKKVVFISRRYNKLKWIAAALLIFSTGMAAYTWKTKLQNKEFVKTIGNSRRENRKDQLEKYRNKDEATISKQTEKASGEKDTISIAKQNNASQSEQNNKAFIQNEKKSLAEDKTANSRIPQGNVRNLVKKDEKANNEKTKLQPEELLAENEGTFAEKKTESSVTVNNSHRQPAFTKEQKNDLTSNVSITSESLYREVTAEPELQKQNLDIETANVLSQKVLPGLRENNRIISQDKIAYTVKNLKVKKPEKNPLSVTVFFSPDFVSSKINNNQHGFREDDRHEIKKNEKIKSAYTTGFLIDYKTSKTFTLATGLTFSSMTTNIQPKKIYARPDNRGNINYRFNCSAGYSYISSKPGNSPDAGDSLPAFSSKNILEYISLPFFVKYNITKGRFSLHPGLGIAINVLTKGKIETAIPGLNGPEKANINHIEGLRQTYLNGSLNVGVNYNLNQTLALSFTPSTKFALTSINKDTPFKTYLNTTGLAAGLTVKL